MKSGKIESPRVLTIAETESGEILEKEPFHYSYFYPDQLDLTDMAGPGDGEGSGDNTPPAQNPKPKGHRTPDTYDGKTPQDFPQWLLKFEMIAKANKWGEGDELKDTLPIYLKDHAFNLYTALPDADTDTYQNMVKALKVGLGIGDNSLTWRLELRQAKRRADESLDVFLFRLAKLADQAFPEDGEERARESAVMEQFILGQKPDLSRHLLEDKQGTLIEVKERAKRFETAQTLAAGSRGIHLVEAEEPYDLAAGRTSAAAEAPEVTEQSLAKAIRLIANLRAADLNQRADYSGPQTPASKRCFQCQGFGHFASKCPVGVGRGRPLGTCYQCGQSGHFKRDCPQRGVGSAPRQNRPGGARERPRCSKCGLFGHHQSDCRTDTSKTCSSCSKKGHLASECRSWCNNQLAARASPVGVTSVSKNDGIGGENGPPWENSPNWD